MLDNFEKPRKIGRSPPEKDNSETIKDIKEKEREKEPQSTKMPADEFEKLTEIMLDIKKDLLREIHRK